MQDLVACGLAATATFVLIYLLCPVAQRVGLIDRPGGRKDHGAAVPLVGGVAMYLGFLAGMGAFTDVPAGWLAVAGAAGALVAVGLADDLVELPAGLRLLVQIGAVWMAAHWAGIRLDSLGALLGPWELELGIVAVPFTLFAWVGVINAYNMIDGVDGLAAGVALVVLGTGAGLALAHGLATDFWVAALLMAVVAAFFVVNFRPAGLRCRRVFMGDAGSLFVGFVIAALLIRLSQGPSAVIDPITAVWMFALPILDTLSLMVRRVRQGRSPFSADRSHLHHVLLRAGLDGRQVVYVVVGASLALAAMGLGMQWAGVPEYLRFYLFALVFLAYLYAMLHAWRFEKALKRWLVAWGWAK